MHGQPAEIDPRIADDSDKALVASLNPASDRDNSSLPLRPDFGTDGREIKLRTNFFPVEVPPGTRFYTYHVAMSPVFMPRRMKKRIYHLAEQTTAWIQAGMSLPGRVAHDNDTRLISAYPLPQPLTIVVPYYDEDERGPPRQGGRVFTLTVKFIQEINTGTLARCLALRFDAKGCSD